MRLLALLILFDPGGRLDEYALKASYINSHSIPVEIAGDCYSACTYLADRARANVCITPAARFHIHQATTVATGARSPVPYSPDFQSYVGPQPTEGFLTLTYPDLAKFWRTCP